ncbi:OB-fold nucleic acid binding domain-containing protein [Streptomyces niveiscabiei]|uniref:OB-fold nucleic acid binding domain-containing protein n=1 Tax=Streptomyces niveiscabiei TaxID=164115 RepID=UPI0029CA2851|nr:OB-fold nucleic acid binding domain-containing protein [Streptomyces niveiscabiei]
MHETAVDAVVPVKKAASHGQDDLFADCAPGDDTPVFGLDLALDDEEWPRRQLLAFEREMLGLYVSAHPLDARDCTLAALLASGRTTGEVRLAGLITGVQRKVTRQGNPWAVVTLADRDAGIEVLFFPAACQFVQHALAEDNVVGVEGRIEERDGTPNVFGRRLELLPEDGGTGACVQLALAAHRVTPYSVREHGLPCRHRVT